jgi:hypothetical protein
VRKDHAPQSMAIVRHVLLNMLNTAKKQFKGVGVKALRKKAGWGNDRLRLILKNSFALPSRLTKHAGHRTVGCGLQR